MHPLLPLSSRRALLPLALFALALFALRIPTVGLTVAAIVTAMAIADVVRAVRRSQVERLRSLGRRLRDGIRSGVPEASLIAEIERAIWRDPDGAAGPLAEGLGDCEPLEHRLDDLVGDYAPEILPDLGTGASAENIVRERLRRVVRVIAPRRVRPHVLVIAPLDHRGDLLCGAQEGQMFPSRLTSRQRS